MTANSMKRLILVGAAMATMGIAMPSCPGQQEMKDQIATLGRQTQALNNRLIAVEKVVKPMSDDNSKEQQILVQMANVINEQKTAITTLNANMTTLQNEITAMRKSGAKGRKKR